RPVKVNPLRSVGTRLSLALLLVVAGSLALVYLVVIPSLEGRLIDSKINQLRKGVHTQLIGKGGVWATEAGSTVYFGSDARDAIGARVVVFRILSAQPTLTITVQQDSSGLRPSNDIEDDPTALRTALSGNESTGTVVRKGARYAEVAFLLPDGEIGLVSAQLKDTLGAVSVARQRLLIAGGIVLVLVLVVGYLAAWVFTRRIRRLERAAD